MAKKPSERRSFKEEPVELNLTPMMNLIAMLIPCLLLSAAFVEIGVINVAAPSINSAPSSQPDQPPDTPPLDLRVTITEAGYTVTGGGGPIPPPGGKLGPGPTLPVIERKISCAPYVGTWPPPRSKNEGSPKCAKSEDMRQFWIYDDETLTKMLVEVKMQFPGERRIIIAAEPGTPYDAIVGVMDASRDAKTPDGEYQVLFDEVLLSPATM